MEPIEMTPGPISPLFLDPGFPKKNWLKLTTHQRGCDLPFRFHNEYFSQKWIKMLPIAFFSQI